MGLFSKWVESLDYRYEVLPECSRHKSNRSTCSACAAACSEDAVSMVKGKPEIDREKCTECGICISACPVQAIAGIYPKRTVRQNELAVEGDRPTAKELLILYKKGVNTIAGETEAQIALWKESIDEANEMLASLEEEPFTVIVKKYNREEEVLTRRELFGLWKKEGKSVLREVVPAKWRFNHKDFDLPKYYPRFQFFSIDIDGEKCSLCGVCEKICEKNCIKIKKDHLSINSQACSSCNLCVDACPEKAIGIDEEISQAEERKFPIYERVCSVCRHTFHSLRNSDVKCPACTMRERFTKQLKEGKNYAI